MLYIAKTLVNTVLTRYYIFMAGEENKFKPLKIKRAIASSRKLRDRPSTKTRKGNDDYYNNSTSNRTV